VSEWKKAFQVPAMKFQFCFGRNDVKLFIIKPNFLIDCFAQAEQLQAGRQAGRRSRTEQSDDKKCVIDSLI